MRLSSWNWPVFARVVLAGPVAASLSLLVLAGMPLWFPPGAAGVDHLVLPLIVLPAVWAVLFFHALLDRSLARVALIALALGSLHAAVLLRHHAASSAPVVQEAAP